MRALEFTTKIKEDISRRGFLKGLTGVGAGAAGLAAINSHFRKPGQDQTTTAEVPNATADQSTEIKTDKAAQQIQSVDDQGVRSLKFVTRLKQVADSLGVQADDLLKVMYFETKGTLDHTITNAIGATGLIQFMPATARSLGTSTDELRRMTATQQLDYVYAYYKDKIKPGMKASDIYLATLLPVALRLSDKTVIAQRGSKQLVPGAEFSKNRMYKQNPVFAKPGKTHYTIADIRSMIDSRSAPTVASLLEPK